MFFRIQSKFVFLALVFALCCAPVAQAQQDVLPDIQKGDIAVRLRAVATGMAAPDYGINPPGDTSRQFVIEQNGLLRLLENDVLSSTIALDIRNLVSNVGTGPLNPANANDERGFLGLAFHSDFNDDTSPGFRKLYTYTSEGNGANPPTYGVPNAATQNYRMVITEWEMSALDPDVVDPASRREVFSFGKNAGNHNGGTIAFGPDEYMYLATGDGGNAHDVGDSHIEPGGNGQNLTTVLGKMLRIDPLHPSETMGSADDPSANGQYRIPDSNPFDGAGEAPEIFAYGFRNPYRFAFDDRPGGTGDLIVADVGQGTIEEIDRVTIGGNYGWAMKEGTFPFIRDLPDRGMVGPNSPGVPAGLIDPISGPMGTLQYDHGDGISITGGFVYRGTGIPELYGKYVFGDLAIRGGPRIDGRLFYADLASGEILEFRIPQFPGDQIPNQLTVHGFGQDGNGELYAMVTNTPANGTGGIIYKFIPVPEPATMVLMLLALGGWLLAAHRR